MEATLPDLCIVPITALVPHEKHDEQRSLPLADRLRADGVLKNPPVVALLGADDPRFVVLDGANRLAAASLLGLPHLLVQTVRYDDPALRLMTWYHVVTACPQDEFGEMMAAVPGLVREPGDLLHARAALARREILAYVVCSDGAVSLLRAAGDLRARTTVLNALVDGYKTCARLFRTTSDRAEDARALYPDLTAIVVFPHYEPAEIIELARDEVRLPAGITRHVIPRRALRVNYPLARLAGPESLGEKSAQLREWLREKVAGKHIRFYEESTVLFDE